MNRTQSSSASSVPLPIVAVVVAALATTTAVGSEPEATGSCSRSAAPAAGAPGSQPADRMCTERPVAVACFAPGTPDEYVREVADRMAGIPPMSLSAPIEPAEFQYTDGDRWSDTATDPSGLRQGDPTTITWSVVPDGTFICGYGGEADADSNLQAMLTRIFGSRAAWEAKLQEVFDRWGALNGTRYVMETDDGRDFTCSTIDAGRLGFRGDVRIAGHRIDGLNGVLAYNFFPNLGDMIIDTSDEANFDDAFSDHLFLRNTVAHEHGHGLGLDHVCPINETKLMEPFLALSFDGPQHDDVLATNRGYGDDGEHNDTAATATSLGAMGSGSSETRTGRSIDDNGDVDYFGFTVSSSLSVSATVTPVGSTYLSGSQRSDASCNPGSSFNSLAIQDLKLDVVDSDGTTILRTTDATRAGSPETLTDVSLPRTTGTFYVRVRGASADAAQLYQLTVSTSALAAAPNVRVDSCLFFDDCAGSGDGDVDPLETLAYIVTFRNVGTADAVGFTADLTVAGATIVSGANVGPVDIAAGATHDHSLVVRVDAACGGTCDVDVVNLTTAGGGMFAPDLTTCDAPVEPPGPTCTNCCTAGSPTGSIDNVVMGVKPGGIGDDVDLSWVGATVTPPDHVVYSTSDPTMLRESSTEIGSQTSEGSTTSEGLILPAVTVLPGDVLYYKVLPGDGCGAAIFPCDLGPCF